MFLIGAPGMGKSTLVANILATRGRELLEKGLLPVRIDMDDALHHDLPPKDSQKVHLLSPIYDVIHKAYLRTNLISTTVRDEVVRLVPYAKDKPEFKTFHAEEAISALYARLWERSHRKGLLLIIDNLDFLYHHYDRGLFIKEAESEEARWDATQKRLAEERVRAHRLVQYVIEAFYRDEGALRNMGANVLIGLRKDSLDHFLAGRSDAGEHDSDEITYRLAQQDAEHVARQHMNLLRAIVAKWPRPRLKEDYWKAAQAIDPTRATGVDERQQELHRHLFGLARQGLRQVITHCGEYVWLPVRFSDDSKDARERITKRFHEQVTPGLIAFIQKGKRHFSQFIAEFPNMYLVRAEWGDQRGEPWANLCRPHKHTYWLKRLIVELIAQQEGTVTAPSKIYRVFCDSGATTRGFYEDHVVRLALGSLSQADKSNVLDFRFFPGSRGQPPWQVEHVSLSRRGRFLMGKEAGQDSAFIDSFTYLQVIVDDYVLPIPNCLAKAFAFRDGLDYGYLASAQYGKGVMRMLEAKVAQVWRFLDVLRLSLACERLAFAGAFARLEEYIKIPDVNRIAENVRRDVEKVQQKLNEVAEQQGLRQFNYQACAPSSEERQAYMLDLERSLRLSYGVPDGISLDISGGA